MLLINQIISSILQVLIFLSIPFLWYCITQKQFQGFWQWIGIKPTPHLSVKYISATFFYYLTIFIVFCIWLYQSGNIHYQGFTIESFQQTGWSFQTILIVLIWAIIQTALSEEIFFRGFLCKLVCTWFGEKVGNGIQALLFGSIHILALPNKTFINMVIIILFTGGIGYSLGLLLKKSQGSILYGWIIHAMVNCISSVIMLEFLIV